MGLIGWSIKKIRIRRGRRVESGEWRVEKGEKRGLGTRFAGDITAFSPFGQARLRAMVLRQWAHNLGVVHDKASHTQLI